MPASRWQERNIATVLLVRSVEEHDPEFFSPEVLSAAALAAASARDDAELIEKRSSYLFLRLPAALKAWARIGLLPESSFGAVVLVAFILGALSNFLGPGGLVHVVYNPLVILLVWNLAVFVLFAARAALRRRPSAAGPLHLLVRDLWSVWNRWAHRLPRGQLRHADEIATTFRRRYWELAGPVVLARIEWLIHAAAICLLAGAISGTYVRGLFLEYNAIWRSTFLSDPEAVAALLNTLFAPGLLLLDGAFVGAAEVLGLRSPGGVPAAPWIHRIALTAALVIVVPRLVLAFLAARRAMRAAGDLRVDLGAEEYYVTKLRTARDGHIHRLREAISTTVRSGVAQLAEALAIFVRDRFFDRSVAPALLRFRNKGGRISDLEGEILAAREAFQPVLLEYLQQGQREFETSVRAGMEKLVGKELAYAPGLLTDLAQPPISLREQVSGSVAGSVGDGLGATVVVGITAIVASLSGGIGQSLGIAVVSGLLGTSGPVGLLLGGVAALAVAGAGYLIGRERVVQAVKGRHIPATIVAFALPEAKLDEARDATYVQVKRDVAEHLEPQVTAATEALLAQLVAAANPAARGAA